MRYRRWKLVTALGILSTLPFLGCPPPPDVTGQAYGGLGSDFAYSVRALPDGGAVVAGTTSSYGFGDKDVYLFRTDADGNELWHKTFGGPGEDLAGAVRVLDDGGYIIAGQYMYDVSDGREDMYLIRTDANGEEVWSKTYGGREWDLAHGVAVMYDGGFSVAGHTSSFDANGTDIYLVRTDSDGTEDWSKTYDLGGDDYAFAMVALPDGGVAIAGTSVSFTTLDFDAFIMRTDVDGNLVWHQVYGQGLDDVALSIDTLDDGGFVIAGWTSSYGANGLDGYLVRTDPDGDEIWHARYGGPYDDMFSGVRVYPDGRIAAAGRYAWESAEDSDNAYAVVVGGDGVEEWHRTYGGVQNDNAQDVDILPDGGLILAGWTDSFTVSRAAYVVRTDAAGIATN